MGHRARQSSSGQPVQRVGLRVGFVHHRGCRQCKGAGSPAASRLVVAAATRKRPCRDG